MTSGETHRVNTLAELPIEVAEAIYSPDFVELSSLTASGTPLSLPMSFTLDLPGNCLRFSSPATASRLANYARDARCSVLCSRVTTGHPPVLIQGAVKLGEVVPGVARGPARRFTVTPVSITILSDPPARWSLGEGKAWSNPSGEKPAPGGTGAPLTSAPVEADDLHTLARQPSTVVTLRDAEGWPLALPAELHMAGTRLTARLPLAGPLGGISGRAAVLGHTWSKAGPRYLAATGRATLTGDGLAFTPARLLRRGL